MRMHCSTALIVLACFALDSACARLGVAPRPAESLPATDQAAPFQSAESAGDRTLAIPQDSKPATALPFHADQACTLPSGTFLTVKLNRTLVPARLHSGDLFVASVVEPLLVDGKTVIETGAEVSGRVESAHASSGVIGQGSENRGTNKGYVQLVLTGITVDGKKLPLQTSSLFVRGTSALSNVSSTGTGADAQADIVRLQRGRRLTFRLTAPMIMAEPHSVAVLKCY
jgi:hypothetical protein